jgi:hypothetical protein
VNKLYGKVTQSLNSSRGKISLFDNKFNPMGTVNTDDKGIYTFSVECGKTYNVRAEKKIIQPKKKVYIADENGKTNLISFRKSTM